MHMPKIRKVSGNQEREVCITLSRVRIQTLMCLLSPFLEVSKLRCLETAVGVDWGSAWAVYYFDVHGWKQ